MNIKKCIKNYQSLGYSYSDASSKICQDIILLSISKSKFKRYITIRGGVVLHNISNDFRRATRDIDLDFIKYSLDDESIKNFIKVIAETDTSINIEIIGQIIPLHHQDYDGKRLMIKITDMFNNQIITKLDIGIEKNFDFEQEEYCFNFDSLGGSANLFINSKEQIFTEKLKSLLKMEINSTRYKDLFDFYYLINEAKVDNSKLNKCIRRLILFDSNMKEECIEDIIVRLKQIFNYPIYRNSLNSPKVNWLDISVDEAINNILKYLENLELILNN